MSLSNAILRGVTGAFVLNSGLGKRDLPTEAAQGLQGFASTGVPQVNLPGAHVDGAPVGLSILGARGTDLDLIRLAVALEG